MIKLLDLNRINNFFYKDFLKIFKDNLLNSSFILSKYLKEFEINFSKFLNIKFCACVGNGTDALEIAIEALDLKKGSEVIVPCNTFIATAESVVRNNLKVKFVDINKKNFGIDLDNLKKKINHRTSAIIVVHLYGIPDNMAEIKKICSKNNLKLIEDCSQAHGSKYKNKYVGTFGDISTFSFFPGKILGGIGDGGACVTNILKYYKKILRIRNHGRLGKFDHNIVGRNSRMDSLNSIFLNLKLNYLKKEISIRNYQKKVYFKYLKNNSNIEILFEEDIDYSICYFILDVKKNRTKLINYLNKKQIQSSIHYPQIIPEMKAFRENNYQDKYKNGYYYSKSLITLPIGSHLKEMQIKYICNCLNNFYG